MSDTHMERQDWAQAAVCICLSGLGLAAIPFVGTKYGDWPEAIAIAIAVLPLIYVAIHAIMRFKARLTAIESRLDALEKGK